MPSAAEPAEHIVLRTDGLTKRFGGLFALKDLCLDVRAGDIHAVIGPNGAGKTTLFNILSGTLAADAGSVEFENETIGGLGSSKRTLRGIARTFQNIRLFSHMTVLENVMLGEHGRTYSSLWRSFWKSVSHPPFGEVREERDMRAKALELLSFVGLADKRDLSATSLPYGQQRLLELARAMATGPRLLLLDEPAAGMNIRETEEVDTLITRIRDRGVTIILVEHDMNLVMGISDRVTVLNFGEKISEGRPEEVQADTAVIEAYLGGEESL